MELLLLIGLGALAYVIWKRSRGEPVAYGRMAGGCLGLGCLGLVLTFIAAVVVLWVLTQALTEVDVSLSDLLESQGLNPEQLGGGLISGPR